MTNKIPFVRFTAACLIGLVEWTGATSVALAQSTVEIDQIKLSTGKSLIPGKVTQTSANEVTYETRSSGSKTVAANEVEYIVYWDAPPELREARRAIFEQNANFTAAKTQLDKVNTTALVRDPVKQDYEYYKALTAARLAQAGQPAALNPAAAQMLAFVKANPNSYHFYEANQVLGELALALGRYDQAANFYAELAKAPWPDFKSQAGVSQGRVLLTLGKPDEAAKAFDAVLTIKGQGKTLEQQQMLATIGKAECQAKGTDNSASIKAIEDVLAKAPAEDRDVQAWGYNAVGNCYQKMNRKKDALLAFLHVDLLFSGVPDAHAESLYHLAQLWAGEKPDRAAQAKQTLKQRYPNSPWAKKPDAM
jgi:tetratricopeptide (TPR) repeat protein